MHFNIHWFNNESYKLVDVAYKLFLHGYQKMKNIAVSLNIWILDKNINCVNRIKVSVLKGY